MKQYNQPTTEVFDLKSENLMLTVSPGGDNGDSSNPPGLHAPGRSNPIPD